MLQSAIAADEAVAHWSKGLNLKKVGKLRKLRGPIKDKNTAVIQFS